jgi:hypothetical protein
VKAALVPRAAMALAYDPVHKATVLFGGIGLTSPALGDTWLLRSVPSLDRAWEAVAPAVSPPGRSGSHAVFDPVRGRTILFGGRSASAKLGDLWEWDGAAWTERPEAHGPLDASLAMAFDKRRATIVAYAGTSGDTWEYQSLGEACTSDKTCDTGHCVDGACCREASCGTCATCRTGLCAPVLSAEDPGTCEGARTCDAAGQCKSKVGATCAAPEECASATCSGGVCCEGGCGLFACGHDGRCLTSCASASDCANGAPCEAGRCVNPTRCEGADVVVSSNGETQRCTPFRCSEGACRVSCTTNDECVSGWVCDEGGRCIATPIAQLSEACAVVGPGRDRERGLGWIGIGIAFAAWRRRRSA